MYFKEINKKKYTYTDLSFLMLFVIKDLRFLSGIIFL